jgi:hypothetical protein
MDRPSAKSSFLALSQKDKELVLLSILYQLTIAIRDVFLTETDGVKLDAAQSASEINHRVLSSIMAVSTGKPRYPDDVLIDIVLDSFSGSSLRRYLPQIWDASIRAPNSP